MAVSYSAPTDTDTLAGLIAQAVNMASATLTGGPDLQSVLAPGATVSPAGAITGGFDPIAWIESALGVSSTLAVGILVIAIGVLVWAVVAQKGRIRNVVG